MQIILALCFCASAWGQILMPIVGGGSSTIAPGGVSRDAVGAGTSSLASPISANHTVTNGATNTAVAAILHWNANGVVTSCTYNGVAMTAIWNATFSNAGLFPGSAVFVIANGTGGGVAHAVSCVTTGIAAGGVALATVSFTGVNQATPYRTPVTGSFSAVPVNRVVANAVSGDLVLDGITTYGNTAPTTTQTLLKAFSNIDTNGFSGTSSTALASGSTTMGYTSGNFGYYGAVAIAHQ